MRKDGDRFDQLSKDDPNYEIARRFHLEGWADSHGLVADTLAGQVSFSDWVESCIRTFQLAADTQAAFKGGIPPSEKCREVDRMARLFIRRFKAKVGSHSKGLGKAAVKTAIAHLSRRVTEIGARSKQQIFQRALAEETSATIADTTMVTRVAPAGNRHVKILEQIVQRKNISVETWAADHKFGRSTVFDWKAARSSSSPLKGKVSAKKAAAIEKAIDQDARELGLSTRTGSD